MTDTGTLLARIPDHVKPLAALIIGSILLPTVGGMEDRAQSDRGTSSEQRPGGRHAAPIRAQG
ncbi:MAG TPA: hypothetical protein VK814_15855 [Acidobacteriaceae bacterium]|nr:hypothetical protein [Acidobacteriaceae bacterium]